MQGQAAALREQGSPQQALCKCPKAWRRLGGAGGQPGGAGEVAKHPRHVSDTISSGSVLCSAAFCCACVLPMSQFVPN